jgi:hypothetical protein
VTLRIAHDPQLPQPPQLDVQSGTHFSTTGPGQYSVTVFHSPEHTLTVWCSVIGLQTV